MGRNPIGPNLAPEREGGCTAFWLAGLVSWAAGTALRPGQESKSHRELEGLARLSDLAQGPRVVVMWLRMPVNATLGEMS